MTVDTQRCARRISLSVVAVIEHRDQGSLDKESFIWVMVLGGESILIGEAWQPEPKVQRSLLICTNEAEKGGLKWGEAINFPGLLSVTSSPQQGYTHPLKALRPSLTVTSASGEQVLESVSLRGRSCFRVSPPGGRVSARA